MIDLKLSYAFQCSLIIDRLIFVCKNESVWLSPKRAMLTGTAAFPKDEINSFKDFREILASLVHQSLLNLP